MTEDTCDTGLDQSFLFAKASLVIRSNNVLPIDLTELLWVSPRGTLIESLLDDLLGTLRSTPRATCIAIGSVTHEGLLHVPDVSLVLCHLEELISLEVVVLARDRAEVLVDGAEDQLTDRLQL